MSFLLSSYDQLTNLCSCKILWRYLKVKIFFSNYQSNCSNEVVLAVWSIHCPIHWVRRLHTTFFCNTFDKCHPIVRMLLRSFHYHNLILTADRAVFTNLPNAATDVETSAVIAGFLAHASLAPLVCLCGHLCHSWSQSWRFILCFSNEDQNIFIWSSNFDLSNMGVHKDETWRWVCVFLDFPAHWSLDWHHDLLMMSSIGSCTRIQPSHVTCDVKELVLHCPPSIPWAQTCPVALISFT